MSLLLGKDLRESEDGVLACQEGFQAMPHSFAVDLRKTRKAVFVHVHFQGSR